MELEPYSIYVDHRPARLAFLTPHGDHGALESFVSYARRKWGGRFYPVVPLTNGELTDDWWAFLRVFDADLLVASCPLPDALRQRIQTFLSPLTVETVDATKGGFRLVHETVGILPSNDVVRSIAGAWLHEQTPLAAFNVPDSAPEAIKQFLARNFGILNQDRLVIHEKAALQAVKLRVFEVFDYASLNTALLQLGDYGRLVFPSQLCAQTIAVPDIEHRSEGGGFGIIVGESFDDLVQHWNRSLSMPSWLRSGLSQIWLPLELATSSAIRPGLTKFVSRYVDTTGNDYEKAARFISFSVGKEELDRISAGLGGGKNFRADTAILSAHPLPRFRPATRRRGIAGQGAWQARSADEHLNIGEPDPMVSPMISEYWVADVTMQYVRRAAIGSVHPELWWQLPQRNSVLHDTRMFNKPARVQASGTFAVFIAKEGVTGSSGSNLIVRVPSDALVMQAFICGPRFDHFETEWRARERSAPFSRIEWSDKGQYLAGVLSLFPDLHNASALFESRLWRRLFERLALAADRDDDLARRQAVKRLRPFLGKPIDLADQETLNALGEKVLLAAREFARTETELCYKHFSEAAQAEIDEFNLSEQGGPFTFEPDDLKSRLSMLMESRVLLAGFRPKCADFGQADRAFRAKLITQFGPS